MLPREIFKAGVPKSAFPSPFGAVSGNRPFSLVNFFSSCATTPKVRSFLLFIKESACRNIHACMGSF